MHRSLDNANETELYNALNIYQHDGEAGDLVG